mgnify:CR=1 FL=1
MKKIGFSPFGLPTLISILTLFLVFSIVSVVIVNVYRTQNSIDRSIQMVSAIYQVEFEADRRLSEINDYLVQKKIDSKAQLEDIIELLTYNEDTQHYSYVIQQNVYEIHVECIKVIENDRMMLKVVKQSLKILNDQDYTQSGYPVYGG